MNARSQATRRTAGRRFLCLALLFAFALSGCRNLVDGANSNLPLGQLEISRNNQTLTSLEVQLALTEPDQAKGLMGVKSLGKHSGMAFLWSEAVRQGFYMKNTLIPLDIAFWDEGGEIVEILQMEPCTLDPCQTYLPASFFVGAVEVNKGLLASEGIKPGDKVTLRQS